MLDKVLNQLQSCVNQRHCSIAQHQVKEKLRKPFIF